MKAKVVGLTLGPTGEEIVELKFLGARPGMYQTLKFRADVVVDLDTKLTLGMEFECSLMLCQPELVEVEGQAV